mmetsp:Transcript_1151/g.3188  ORF Transcript_1151/g.3188 Transcript_1151/m.3188 type:complete len:264 (+) Transcript_1151:402-1193(+)
MLCQVLPQHRPLQRLCAVVRKNLCDSLGQRPQQDIVQALVTQRRRCVQRRLPPAVLPGRVRARQQQRAADLRCRVRAVLPAGPAQGAHGLHGQLQQRELEGAVAAVQHLADGALLEEALLRPGQRPGHAGDRPAATVLHRAIDVHPEVGLLAALLPEGQVRERPQLPKVLLDVSVSQRARVVQDAALVTVVSAQLRLALYQPLAHGQVACSSKGHQRVPPPKQPRLGVAGVRLRCQRGGRGGGVSELRGALQVRVHALPGTYM